MKELGITKGDAIEYLKENICKDTMLPNDVDFNTTNGYLASEMMSAFAREKNSELLQRYNEAIEVLKSMRVQLHSWKKQHPETVGYIWAVEIEKVLEKHEEQTISKAKGE